MVFLRGRILLTKRPSFNGLILWEFSNLGVAVLVDQGEVVLFKRLSGQRSELRSRKSPLCAEAVVLICCIQILSLVHSRLLL